MDLTTSAGARPAVATTSDVRTHIGVCDVDITPPAGVRHRNWPASGETATEVHRSMRLVAMAVGAPDDDAQVLITLDGTWWRRAADEWALRSRVLDALGLPEANVVIALSHTHAGPVLASNVTDLPGGAESRAYLDLLAERAVAAAASAVASRVPAVLQWSLGRCSLAVERDLGHAGRAVVGFNPDVDADDAVLVGRATSDAGHVLATVVNYACHPTTLAWQNDHVSPDYVGSMRDMVEAATRAPCLFLQGASGELSPRDQYTGELAVADRNGEVLGHAVLSTLVNMPPAGTALTLDGIVESGAPLAIWSSRPTTVPRDVTATVQRVEMDVRPLTTLDELSREWPEVDGAVLEERLRRATDLREGYVTGPVVDHPVWVWRLGDAVLVAHPGEAYSLLQTELRRRFPDHHVVVSNLANGPGFVYLPTPKAYGMGTYQSWQTVLAEGSLERLIDRSTEVIRDLLQGPSA